MATDLNHVFLIGRLTKDVGADERSYTVLQNGTAKAVASIAVNRSRKQGDQWVDDVSYFDITIWNKQAENLKPYLKKGTQICVSGYLKQDRWEKDGQKRSAISIIADSVQLLGGKKDGGKASESPAPAEQSGYTPADGDYPSDIPF